MCDLENAVSQAVDKYISSTQKKLQKVYNAFYGVAGAIERKSCAYYNISNIGKKFKKQCRHLKKL